MVINTEAFEFAKQAQLEITPKDLPSLDHKSHIDTSKLITLQPMETQGMVDSNPACHVGSLSLETRQAIKGLVLKHGIMPKDQAQSVVGNL